jgi:hypothetical protein
MDDILKIELQEKSGHNDLSFCIKDLTGDLSFDTYYFGLAIEPVENFQEIKNCVADFLRHWVTQTETMQSGQSKYFPIDISDQYTGCVKIDKNGENLSVAYGHSKREGWKVNINNPINYFDSILDFENDSPKTIDVRQVDFVASIKKQIDELKSERK